MKLPGLVLASFCLLVTASRAADATTPLDAAGRNTLFAPAATIAPDRQTPQVDRFLQDRRVELNAVDKPSAALGDRRAPIDVHEARAKTIRQPAASQPEVVAPPTSAFNHRESSFSTTSSTRQPVRMAKYQDSLAAASATNMARFPALDGATSAKINRFVFRRNGPDAGAAFQSAPVTPAASRP